MTIYAIFLCLSVGCQHVPSVGSHIVYRNGEPIGQSDFFASRSECDRVLREQLGDNAGEPNSGGAFYRCLGRHVDPWR